MTKKTAKMLYRCAVASAIFAALGVAQAADFPSKPIRVIVPFPPGGGLDTLIRTIEPEASRRFGRPLVIESRAGAGGSIGMQLAVTSPPDGHTVVLAANTATIDPSYRPKLPYTLQRDLAPVTMLVASPYVIIATPNLPANGIAEFIAYAKANPGRTHFASSGIGTVAHMTGELFKYVAGIDLVHIPYKGSGPSVAAVMSGEVQISFETPQIMSIVRSGKVKALGVTSRERWPAGPEVPSVSESLPAFEMMTWIGMFAPARTPPDVVNQLSQVFAGSVTSAETSPLVISKGFKPVGNTAAEFARQIAIEVPMWAKVIRDANIKPEE